MASLPPTLIPATLDTPEKEAPPPQAAAFEYQLVHATNPTQNTTVTAASDLIMGRDSTSCSLAYPEVPVLSRKHCRIFTMGRDVFIHDLSSNGTFLNGKAIGKDNKKTLRSGDVVSIINPKLPEHNSFCWRVVGPPTNEEPAEADGVASKYDLGKVLGTGNFATVRLAKSRATGEAVAVKVVQKKQFAMQADFSFSSLHSEVEILRKMSHPNIVGVRDVFDTSAAFTMVLELVSGGDLFDYIVGRCPSPFTEAEARVLFIQLLEAVLYMHSKDVVHRDLKPENILVQVDPNFRPIPCSDDHQRNAPHIPVSMVRLKITDFGLAKFCAEQDVMTTMCGTPSYLAPEVRVRGENGRAAGYGWTVDVWSLGVILYILLSGMPPKAPETGNLTFGKPFANVSKDATDLVQWMLKVDPRARADLADIVGCRWLSGHTISNGHLAEKKDRLKLQGTTILQPMPTVVQKELPGNVTEGEESDGDISSPRPGKRPRAEDLMRRVSWQWKADLSKPDADDDSWQAYSVTDTKLLEQMFHRKVPTCKVGTGEYRVSYEGMFQYKTDDTSRQRPVRRLIDAESVKKLG